MNLSTFEAFKNLNTDGMGIPVEGETLKKCQEVILRIAEDVVSVCEEEGIWYQLGGGTALGAVRGGGFIPWDDDIDLNILGKDFEKLGEKIKAKYGEKYTYLTYSSPDYGLPMGKVMLNHSVFRDRESVGSENCGFFVDIFPLENVPDSRILRKMHGALCMAAGGILSCRKFYKNRAFFAELMKRNPDLKKLVSAKIGIGRCFSFLPLETCARITDRIYGLCKNEHSRYVSFPSGRKHYFGETYPRSGMVPTISFPFEGHQWPVPKDYDSYFRVLYGEDYMTPPPESKREHHILLELKFPEE